MEKIKFDFSKKTKLYSDSELETVFKALEEKSSRNSKEKILYSKLKSEIAKRSSTQPAAGVFINDDELKKSLNEQSFLVNIEIDKILDNNFIDRSGVDETKLKELDGSIKKHGLLQAINVLDNKNGTYTRIFGRRRVLSHKRLGLSKIKAYVYEGNLSLQDLRMKIIHENVIREDLNEYDKVRNVLELLKEPLALENQEEIIAICQKAKNINKLKDIEGLEEQKLIIENILDESKLYNSLSALINALPVLNMDKYLIASLTKNELTFTLAKTINSKRKIIEQNKLDFKDLINYSIRNDFSSKEFLEYLEKQLPIVSKTTIDNKINNITKSFKKLDILKKEELYKELEQIAKKYLK